MTQTGDTNQADDATVFKRTSRPESTDFSALRAHLRVQAGDPQLNRPNRGAESSQPD